MLHTDCIIFVSAALDRCHNVRLTSDLGSPKGGTRSHAFSFRLKIDRSSSVLGANFQTLSPNSVRGVSVHVMQSRWSLPSAAESPRLPSSTSSKRCSSRASNVQPAARSSSRRHFQGLALPDGYPTATVHQCPRPTRGLATATTSAADTATPCYTRRRTWLLPRPR